MLENKSKGEKSYIILRYRGKQPHNQVGKMIEDKNEIETNTWKQKEKKKRKERRKKNPNQKTALLPSQTRVPSVATQTHPTSTVIV